MAGKSGSAHIIPLLWYFSGALEPLKAHVESFGYSILNINTPDFKGLNLINPPLLAIVPLAYKTTTDEVRKYIAAYERLFPKANTTFMGVYSGRLQFRIPELYQAGLNCLYQSPMEEELLLNKIFEISPIVSEHKNLTLDQLLRVSLAEIEKTKILPFDLFLYLPMNKKAILYVEKGHEIDDKTIKKFQSHQKYNLYVRRSDIKSYQEYGKKLIQEFGFEKDILDNERNKERAVKIAGLLGCFFSENEYTEDEGKQMLQNLKAFTQDISDQPGKNTDLETSLNKIAPQKLTSVSHSQNVSAYCALFGMAAGLANPELLRMGGLLHDIGVSELPPELALKSMSVMTDADQIKYKSHPTLGQAAVDRMKMKLPNEVMDMILYHHEQTNGLGYPHGRASKDIPPYAKVCAFADEFDKLTSVRAGFPQLSPFEAIQAIAGLNGKPPSPIYDPVFHKPIVDAFTKAEPDAAASSTTAAKPASAPPETVADLPKKGGIPISRLLKTPEFAKPAYLPEFKFAASSVQSEMNDLAEQLSQHFKRKP